MHKNDVNEPCKRAYGRGQTEGDKRSYPIGGLWGREYMSGSWNQGALGMATMIKRWLLPV